MDSRQVSTESSWSNASNGHGHFRPILSISSAPCHWLARYNELQLENSTLLTKNTALEAKTETLMWVRRLEFQSFRIRLTSQIGFLTHIPAATQPQHTPLRHEDYPKVRFWTRQAWNSAVQDQILEVEQPDEAESFPDIEVEEGDELNEPSAPSPADPARARGKHRSSQGINVTMKYIELEDGTVVDGYRAAEIRRFARSLWVQMALNQQATESLGRCQCS